MKLEKLSAIVLTVVLTFIFIGLGVYIVGEVGRQANITVLNNLANTLGNWAITWMPIILIVVAASVIIGLLIRGFAGR